MNINNCLSDQLIVKIEENIDEDFKVRKENHREFNQENLIDIEEIKVETNENLDDEFTSDMTEIGDIPIVKAEILFPTDEEVYKRTPVENYCTTILDDDDPLSVTETSFKYGENTEHQQSSRETSQQGFSFVNIEDIKRDLRTNFRDETEPSDRNNYTIIQNGLLKSYCCNLCPLKCRYKSHIDRHMMQHTGERPYACTMCPAKFTHRGNLNGHMRIHSGEKPFRCDICSKQFSEKSNIKRHIRIHMRVPKPYHCEICSKHFREVKYLKQHMQNIHVPKVDPPKPRVYKCLTCEAIFRQTSALKKHLLVHSKDQPFACDVCSIKFEYEDERDEHMVTHKLKFACEICPSKFVHRGNMVNHMRVYHPDVKLEK
ncbi:GSCOCG00009993001-RA-CDS [Cotesia congregata]|uniref:Similar to ZNF677: Zinc finger protein 677 (Homo sapiens) n=1 Tax=Cotesia congregata TaxID=51543 RepID=A0A8J2HAX5_COTCN|nr:GSCOCG00009993001-RA-CDS [Cotesia congregata]CAG5090912.1 Similar to ZNF677: Zinc finger protein 677 (Homo sapiens) [Cotesia congregata]